MRRDWKEFGPSDPLHMFRKEAPCSAAKNKKWHFMGQDTFDQLRKVEGHESRT